MSVLAEKEIDKIKELSLTEVKTEAPPPPFQIQVAKGQLRKPIASHVWRSK